MPATAKAGHNQRRDVTGLLRSADRPQHRTHPVLLCQKRCQEFNPRVVLCGLAVRFPHISSRRHRPTRTQSHLWRTSSRDTSVLEPRPGKPGPLPVKTCPGHGTTERGDSQRDRPAPDRAAGPGLHPNHPLESGLAGVRARGMIRAMTSGVPGGRCPSSRNSPPAQFPIPVRLPDLRSVNIECGEPAPAMAVGVDENLVVQVEDLATLSAKYARR
jgi:hypothetical protein